MTGKKLIDTILTLVSLLTTLAVLGLFYYTEKIYKKPPIDENKEKEALFKETNKKTLPFLYKIDKMTISLSSENEKNNQRMHWLEVELSLALFKEEDQGFVKAYQALVLDRIIGVTSKMGKDEINTLSGKVILEDRLKNEINKILEKKVVKNIYFSKFIVQ
jgi:flagellar FliL protein